MSKATGILIKDKVKTILVGQKFLLEPKILPAGAIQKDYELSVDNSTIAGFISDSYVQGFNPGTAVIQARLKDTGLTALCLVKVVTGFQSST